jgi:hypothetical protein
MKVSDEISILNIHVNHNMYCVKLVKSLYDLKQSGRMWYNRLKEFLLNKWYSNNDDCSCMFIRKSTIRFCIISVYVNELNIIGHKNDIDEARNHLETEFEMKDFGRTKFCLGLQLEHLQTGILVHQSTYVQKIMHLANNIRPDIAPAMNYLARHNATPTMHHWNDIKNILRYVVGTIDLGLHFQKNKDSKLIGYGDVGYLSDHLNARSQTGYVFLYGGTSISWKPCKQTLVATSVNHSEIIVLYEASRECAWLRRMIDHI